MFFRVTKQAGNFSRRQFDAPRFFGGQRDCYVAARVVGCAKRMQLVPHLASVMRVPGQSIDDLALVDFAIFLNLVHHMQQRHDQGIKIGFKHA